MDLNLEDKIAVVTGGSSGIGYATAETLLAEGARVVICGRDTTRLKSASERLLLKYEAGRLLALRCDVTSSQNVHEFASAVDSWSGRRVDLLVTNAGQGRTSTFSETSTDDWLSELELKFFSQILPIRAFLPLLEKSETPSIVAVNSLLALQPEAHMVCTSAARAGVQNLIKSLATEFAPKIRVNSVLIGLINSGQWSRRFEARADKSQSSAAWLSEIASQKGIPLGRLGDPIEAARVIAFLGSNAASYVTGASVEISGGLSRHI